MNSGWQLPSSETISFFKKKTPYCVVIPVLNEGDRIRQQLKRMQKSYSLADTVIVDGGSTDGATSPSELENSGIRTLIRKTGPGKLSAQMRLGLAYALTENYRGVILIDGNNKDNPDQIAGFARELDEGADHVQGSRFIPGGVEENTPFSRKLAIKAIHAPLISLASGFHYTDTTNGFRAYSRKLLEDPRVQPFRDIFSAYELHYYLAIRAAKLGFHCVEIPVERRYPSHGKVPTKISGWKGNWIVMKTLLRACMGAYDPKNGASP